MILHNQDLQDRHTLRCPSLAEYAAVIDEREQIASVRSWWQRSGCALQLLGQGSNVLCPEHVVGLTVHNTMQGYDIEHEDVDRVRVRVASGTSWHEWVQFCAAQGWHGLENLALIPGTVGASPVQNIGAYGVEVAACVARVDAFHWHTGESVSFSPEQCQFAYRSSLFKSGNAASWLITDVVFELSKHFSPILNYAPLDQLDASQLNAAQLIAEVSRVRRVKLPNPSEVPNAGSFFTNPVISLARAKILQQICPDLPQYPINPDQVKISAAYLIDQAGWKGWQDAQTGVGTWQHHALVLINPDRQPLSAVMQVAQAIQHDILERYQVLLDIEPQRIDRQSIQP